MQLAEEEEGGRRWRKAEERGPSVRGVEVCPGEDDVDIARSRASKDTGRASACWF